jgi:hypothetical protein
MLIFADRRLPVQAKEILSPYGSVADFSTTGITYPAISCHPDIFFCPTPAGLVVAPNLPEEYIALLKEHQIPFLFGEQPVGDTYPDSARYNALLTDQFCIRAEGITDPSIAALNPGLETIRVRQGYIRCNLLALPDGSFLTSDRGIENVLRGRKLNVLFVDSTAIRLHGFPHGFFGGACGIYGDTLFFCGSLDTLSDSGTIRHFIRKSGLNIVELFDSQPLDAGTILFLPG